MKTLVIALALTLLATASDAGEIDHPLISKTTKDVYLVDGREFYTLDKARVYALSNEIENMIENMINFRGSSQDIPLLESLPLRLLRTCKNELKSHCPTSMQLSLYRTNYRQSGCLSYRMREPKSHHLIAC